MENKKGVGFNPDFYVDQVKRMFKSFENEIFYMAGSLVEGVGNEYSDIDLFLLTNNAVAHLGFNDEVNIDSLTYKTTNSVIIDNTRFDIEIINLNQLVEKIDKINEFSFTRRENVFSIMWFNYVDIIHKLLTSIPIFCETKQQEVIKRLNRKKFNQVVSAMHLLKADGFMEDVEGTYLMNDTSTLYYTSHFMLQCLMKSYLAIRGYTNTNSKWIIHALRKLNTEKDRMIMHKYEAVIEYNYRLDGERERYTDFTYRVMELYHLINEYVQECLEHGE